MKTSFEPYQAKSIMFRNEEPDGFLRGRYSVNPYMGCSMGCRYCGIQEKKYNSSAALEERKDSVVRMKINAPYLLEKRLESEEPERGLIVMGESCEPYDRPEEKYLITRNLMEILSRYDYPLHIMTKSPLILRDLDILRDYSSRNFLSVTVSVPLQSREMAGKFEAEAPPVKERFRTVRSLRKAGITCGIDVSPLIPYISDGEEAFRVLKRAAACGASYVVFSPLSIKPYKRDMFFAWLSEKYPRLIGPYERLYGEGETPDADYVRKFSQKFIRRAEELKLRTSFPFSEGEEFGYRQDFLRLHGTG